MRRFIKMKNTVIDMKTNLTFVKDSLYKIVVEFGDSFLIVNQDDVPCCIKKGGEGIDYIVVERE